MGGRELREEVMVVAMMVVMIVVTQGAYIDRRMPRVTCAHYRVGDEGEERIEECRQLEDGDDDRLPVDFFCQTTWYNKSKPGTGHSSHLHVLMQGCIPVYSDHEGLGLQHEQCINKTQCVSTSEVGKGKGQNNDVHFCCCHANECNAQFHWRPDPPSSPPPPAPPVVAPPSTSPWFLLLYTLVPVFVVLVLASAGCYVYHHRKHARFNSLSSLGEDAPASPPTPTLTHRPVEFLEIKARGRFGAVWKGQVGKDMVAVKIFPLQDKQSWFAEQEIYNLPQLSHDNILQFLGVDRRGEGLQAEFWLVTSFHEHGSLCDFLKNNIINLNDLVKICLTMAKGLAHLHGELAPCKGMGLKPAIAHRDFKSKNVLIKSDMTACIGDFGLALKFRPNEVVGDTHGQVGTRRYMAPEVLEGAINFSRDAFLRIDMYACGLVLWEVATRCKVVDTVEQPYRLPFEIEASDHPSLEEICDLVVNKKVRPQLQESWRSHPGLHILCETIEECWDHDAEARLSSSCVVERLQQLKMVVTGTATNSYHQNFQNLNFTSPEQVHLIPTTQTSTDVTYEDEDSSST